MAVIDGWQGTENLISQHFVSDHLNHVHLHYTEWYVTRNILCSIMGCIIQEVSKCIRELLAFRHCMVQPWFNVTWAEKYKIKLPRFASTLQTKILLCSKLIPLSFRITCGWIWRLLSRCPYCDKYNWSTVLLHWSPKNYIRINESFTQVKTVCRTKAMIVYIVTELCNYNPVFNILGKALRRVSILRISVELTVTIISCTVLANWGWKLLLTYSSAFLRTSDMLKCTVLIFTCG